MSDLALSVLWINPVQADTSLNKQIVPWAKPLLMAGHRLVAESWLASSSTSSGLRKG